MRSSCLLFVLCCAACGDNVVPAAPDAATSGADAAKPDAAPVSPLDGNRERLLATYLMRLKSIPAVVQSNGLVGHDLSNVCDLWSKLDPSSRAVVLTLTHRLQGAMLRDGSHVLDHVTRLYRAIGGEGASASAAGSCGGGEYNRIIASVDHALHDALVAATKDQGALGSDGKYDVADVTATSYWRDSENPAGPHAPFDTEDETSAGAPRAQAQLFADPTSAAANAPLGRMDVTDVVDPLALEVDQVYDCLHDSNPTCTYVNYGPLCAQEPAELGTAVYTADYGDFEPGWQPIGCTVH